MTKRANLYTIPTAITKDVADVIIKQYTNDLKWEKATIASQNPVEDEKIRQCKAASIATDSWVAGMLSHFVHCSNNQLFKFDLKGWSERIQFLMYDKPGDHYHWHSDLAPDKWNPKEDVRKLTIVLCLSSKDDYEGGELEIITSLNAVVDDFIHRETLKLDVGDAVIFPTDTLHRVTPLKSGKRIVLCSWFGGPNFR